MARKKRILSPKSIWDSEAVSDVFHACHANPIHIPRLYRYLIRNPGSTWRNVPSLPKSVVTALDAGFTMLSSKLIHKHMSKDDTIKLLLRMQDGLEVETVIMHYDTRSASRNLTVGNSGDDVSGTTNGTGEDEASEAVTGSERATLCVSSEVGCQMGCTFCATGTMGLIGDLTSAEIIEQLVHAKRFAPIRNVVFMGMGEPLNNYVPVRTAVSMMIDPDIFALRRRSVTISTVGVIPRIRSLSEDLPGVSLALSLHAPNQELRQQIVPSARAYKLEKLISAIDAYQAFTGQRVFVEYVMLGPDVNCTAEHAHQLGKLLQGKDVVVNLIPWNPILSPAMDFKAPPDGVTAQFQSILKEYYSLPSTIRQEKGQDVNAACGQLALTKSAGCERMPNKDIDIEDMLL